MVTAAPEHPSWTQYLCTNDGVTIRRLAKQRSVCPSSSPARLVRADPSSPASLSSPASPRSFQEPLHALFYSRLPHSPRA